MSQWPVYRRFMCNISCEIATLALVVHDIIKTAEVYCAGTRYADCIKSDHIKIEWIENYGISKIAADP